MMLRCVVESCNLSNTMALSPMASAYELYDMFGLRHSIDFRALLASLRFFLFLPLLLSLPPPPLFFSLLSPQFYLTFFSSVDSFFLQHALGFSSRHRKESRAESWRSRRNYHVHGPCLPTI